MSERQEDGAAVGLSCFVKRNESIVFTELDDTIVMMDVDEGQYFELDPVAARIWEIVENGATARDICDVLASEYEVAADVCERETLEFLHTAGEQRIFTLESESGEGAAA